MATVVINAYSIAFPTITNSIRVDIATQANPTAVVATQTKVSPHPERIWSFPGLTRTNYVFTMSEIDGSGAILRQLAFFDIVPGDLTDGIYRQEEQIKVGVTPGLVAGATNFVFDGTSGKPNYKTWEISPEMYGGVGTLIRGTDYSWDSATGTFAFLTAGQTFDSGQWLTIEFQPQAGGGALSVPTTQDFTMKLITANYTITTADFGTKIVVEPSGNFITLTLPNITTVATGRPLMIETKSAQEYRCVQIAPYSTNLIKFQFGKLFLMMNEALTIYRFVVTGRNEWRIYNMMGNFQEVGRIVANDLANVYNRIPLDGASLDRFAYARLYNELVLRLPVSQVVNFDDWVNNPTFYSLANSSVPANKDKFHVPDRRGLFERYNATPRVVGSYEPDAVGKHKHDYTEIHANSFTGATSSIAGSGGVDPQGFPQQTFDTGTNMGTETTVKNYSIYKYILV